MYVQRTKRNPEEMPLFGVSFRLTVLFVSVQPFAYIVADYRRLTAKGRAVIIFVYLVKNNVLIHYAPYKYIGRGLWRGMCAKGGDYATR